MIRGMRGARDDVGEGRGGRGEEATSMVGKLATASGMTEVYRPAHSPSSLAFQPLEKKFVCCVRKRGESRADDYRL